MVRCLVAFGDYLFSGSFDHTIRKWNEEGECLAIFAQHTSYVISLLVLNGELYSSSGDRTLKRWNLDGQVLEEYKGNWDCVRSFLWRGALFSAGCDEVIQWMPFSLWSQEEMDKWEEEEMIKWEEHQMKEQQEWKEEMDQKDEMQEEEEM